MSAMLFDSDSSTHDNSHQNHYGSTSRSSPLRKIAARSVDPSKLVDFLDNRVGKNNYHVVMQHNKYNIKAEPQLTDVDIRDCLKTCSY